MIMKKEIAREQLNFIQRLFYKFQTEYNTITAHFFFKCVTTNIVFVEIGKIEKKIQKFDNSQSRTLQFSWQDFRQIK